MAFNTSELSLMAYTGADGGHHLYWYSNTLADDITDPGFFDSASEQMNEGDVIYEQNGMQFYSVTDVTDGAVTVALVNQPT